MKAKKLHTDVCYVCIISFILSVLALTLALGYDAMALSLALMMLALLTSQTATLQTSFGTFSKYIRCSLQC